VTPRQRTPIGLLLVLPAFAVLVVSYLWPTIWTVWASFRRVNPPGLPIGASVGTGNYTALFDAGLAGTFGFALLLGLLPLMMAVVVAPLLAWAAHRAGAAGRRVTRGVLALPLVCFAPTALAVAWKVDHRTGPAYLGCRVPRSPSRSG
jgi:ABC-type sugar transport system permease subunit